MTKEAKLLRALYELNLPRFSAAEILTLVRPALDEYFEVPHYLGVHSRPAICVGMALRNILKTCPVQDGLRLQGRYVEKTRAQYRNAQDKVSLNKPLKVWMWRVVDAASVAEKSEQIEAVPNPLPETIRVDSTGHRHVESFVPGPYHSPPEISEAMRRGVWEKDGAGEWQRIDEPGNTDGSGGVYWPPGPMTKWSSADLQRHKDSLRSRVRYNNGPSSGLAWFIAACRAHNRF